MAHSYPETVELKGQWNKVIKKGKSNRPFLGGMASRERTTFVSMDGRVLDKPIAVYRMWYRFLQLALELEQQKVQIVTNTKTVELKKPKKDAWGKLRHSERVPVRQKVKVNRKVYESWDLDIIPFTSFDDWWKGKSAKKGAGRFAPNTPSEIIKVARVGVSAHSELFYPDSGAVILNSKNEWDDNPNYTYIRIDKRRRVNDLVNDVRMVLAKQERETSSVSQFPIQGSPNINTLINRYNALILQLTTNLKDKEILASKVFRPTQEGMGDDETDIAYTYGGSEGRAMRDLILPAKIALLSVCDGYFVSNPHKEYI